MLLSGFGDDSADETKSRVFAVASVIADDNTWRELERSWLERNKGIPFHATDCDSDNGIYAGRSHVENKELYKDLAQMLVRSGARGFGVVVDLAAHRKFFPNVPEELSYHFCFTRVIGFLARYAVRVEATELKLSFDNRLETNFNAAYLYSVMLQDEDLPYRHVLAGDVSFLCSEKNPKIQIGDIYARECMKLLDNIVGPKKRDKRKSMIALEETGRFGADIHSEEFFQDWHGMMEELQRRAGYNQQDYLHWLERHKSPDTVSNRFRFLAFLGKADK
jgi:hypothetical protein